VALYRTGEHRVAESDLALAIPKNTTLTFGVEQILGHFYDVSCAYRFGPPGHDVIAVSLHGKRGDLPFAQTFRFPAGRTTQRTPISELGMAVKAQVLGDGTIEVLFNSLRFVWGVRAAAPGWAPDDAYFGIEPGGRRRIALNPLHPGEPPASITVTAVNAEGRLTVPVERIR